jgi:hypothetical protein
MCHLSLERNPNRADFGAQRGVFRQFENHAGQRQNPALRFLYGNNIQND